MKTLLELHYELRIEVLRDDPGSHALERLRTVEAMAKEYGWKYLCDKNTVAFKATNVLKA